MSEGNILAHIAALEEIGFRIVGTEEAVKGEEYVIDEVVKLKERCDEGGIIKCDMWIQIGDGVHQSVFLPITERGYETLTEATDSISWNTRCLNPIKASKTSFSVSHQQPNLPPLWKSSKMQSC